MLKSGGDEIDSADSTPSLGRSISLGQFSPLLNPFPRRLLLIALDWTRPKDPPVALGHASIVARLREAGVLVTARSWSVHDADFNVDLVVDFIRQNNASGVDLGIGVFVWNELYVQAILSRVRALAFKGRIILGGSQVSYTKSGLEDYYPNANVFIRGYGEEALAALMLSSSAFPSIQGVHYAGQFDHRLSAVADLALLPSPYLTGVLSPQKFLRIEFQRGCPFRCAFCQHRESDDSKVRRHFASSRILSEIDWLCDHAVVDDVAVLDPIFNTGPMYMSVLRRFVERRYKGKLSLQCRLELVTPEFLTLVEEFNEHGRATLEFGLQTIHPEEERHIQRLNHLGKVQDVLRQTATRGIQTEVSLIFGLPAQTVNSFRSTVNYCKALRVPTIYAYPLRLYRGTPLYEMKEDLGLIESTEPHFHLLKDKHIGHVVQSPSFSLSDWYLMAAIARELDDYNAQNAACCKVERKMPATPSNTLFRGDEEACSRHGNLDLG